MSARIAILLLIPFVLLRSAQIPNDPRIGTWKINLAKSKFNPGPPPKSMTVRFESWGDDGLKVTIDTVEANGEVRKHQYTAQYDGKDHPVSGDPGRDTVALKRIDLLTLEYTNKKAGKVINTYREVIARDGKSRTITQKGMSSRSVAVDNEIVYDKQ
jgi:hypothetical protein